ncbi:MAG: sigma-54-dependent transcriptional regulator, partial [Candidatus Oleimicrobiaceae bacterium]
MTDTERLILVVDDEEDSLSSRLELLRNLGYSCLGVSNGHQALNVLREKKPWVILADLVMPHMSGIELLKLALEEDPDVVVVIYTGYASIDSAKKAIREGAFDYIPKPFSSDDLRIVVERALKYAELTRENSALRSQIEAVPRPDKIVGTSDAIKKILEQVRKVARTSANVMVTGESGTGKELVARAIHYYSSRASRAFVAVDCAALPENLLESELFGYERGAFTGAVTTKEGLIEI